MNGWPENPVSTKSGEDSGPEASCHVDGLACWPAVHHDVRWHDGSVRSADSDDRTLQIPVSVQLIRKLYKADPLERLKRQGPMRVIALIEDS